MQPQNDPRRDPSRRFSWERDPSENTAPAPQRPHAHMHREQIEMRCLAEARAHMGVHAKELRIARFENEELKPGSRMYYDGFKIFAAATPSPRGSQTPLATCVYIPLASGALPEIPYIIVSGERKEVGARIRTQIEAWSKEQLGLSGEELLIEAQRNSTRAAPHTPTDAAHRSPQKTSPPLEHASSRPALARQDDFVLLDSVLIADGLTQIGLAALSVPSTPSAPDIGLFEGGAAIAETAGEVAQAGSSLFEGAGEIVEGAGDLLSGLGDAAGDILGGLF